MKTPCSVFDFSFFHGNEKSKQIKMGWDWLFHFLSSKIWIKVLFFHLLVSSGLHSFQCLFSSILCWLQISTGFLLAQQIALLSIVEPRGQLTNRHFLNSYRHLPTWLRLELIFFFFYLLSRLILHLYSGSHPFSFFINYPVDVCTFYLSLLTPHH